MKSPRKLAWAAGSTPCCKPASSPSAVCCPKDEAITEIKKAIKKTYGKRGEEVVQRNYAAVDMALDHLHQVEVPAQASADFDMRPPVPADAPEFVRNVLGTMIAS